MWSFVMQPWKTNATMQRVKKNGENCIRQSLLRGVASAVGMTKLMRLIDSGLESLEASVLIVL